MKMIYRPTSLTLLAAAVTIAAISGTTGYISAGKARGIRSPQRGLAIGVLMGSNRCRQRSATSSGKPAAEATS